MAHTWRRILQRFSPTAHLKPKLVETVVYKEHETVPDIFIRSIPVNEREDYPHQGDTVRLYGIVVGLVD